MIIIIGASFVYIKNTKQSAPAATMSSAELTSRDLDNIVNKYIKNTNEEALRTKIMAEKSIIETKKRLAEQDLLNKIKQDKENASIPLEHQIRKEPQVETLDSPAELINAKIYEKNQQDKMDEAEKKEYAREWIRNARSAGYLLELSPDLEVIRYTPIRKPSQQDDSTESYPSD